MRIALITCQHLPEPDHDQDLLLGALRDAGAQASLLAWDDPTQDVAAFDRAVLRSTWNYYRAPDAFRAWLARAGALTHLMNPADIALGNLHKGYLRDLQQRGVPIVPTAWIEAGTPRSLDDLRRELGADDLVLKPAVSAGSWRTRRLRPDADPDDAARFIHTLADAGDAMAQPYLPSVETTGERALVWIDGDLTHAVRKSPRFDDDHEAVSPALQPTQAERDFARRVLEPLAGRLLYGRVDIMWGDDGLPLLSELELLEPSLFLRQHPPALQRLVAAILR